MQEEGGQEEGRGALLVRQLAAVSCSEIGRVEPSHISLFQESGWQTIRQPGGRRAAWPWRGVLAGSRRGRA